MTGLSILVDFKAGIQVINRGEKNNLHRNNLFPNLKLTALLFIPDWDFWLYYCDHFCPFEFFLFIHLKKPFYAEKNVQLDKNQICE